LSLKTQVAVRPPSPIYVYEREAHTPRASAAGVLRAGRVE